MALALLAALQSAVVPVGGDADFYHRRVGVVAGAHPDHADLDRADAQCRQPGLASFARVHVNIANESHNPTAGETGQIFAFFVIAIAAAEAAVGLAIVITYFRKPRNGRYARHEAMIIMHSLQDFYDWGHFIC